jgi:hypothetical protein
MRRGVSLLAGLVASLLLLAIVLGVGRRVWPVAALAVGLGVLLLLRHRLLPTAERAGARGVLVLALLLLPTLVQFHGWGGRINGDGVMYYVYVHSLAHDRDLDLTNEYAHYGLLEREDIRVPTRTGLRRSIFAVGPGLLGLPFFAVGEAVGRLESLVRSNVDLSGYGPVHVNAVALGSLLLGFGAVLLMHDLLRRYFREGVALGAALLIWLATFLHWYMVQQPTMSHAPSAFGAALVVWFWNRRRGEISVPRFAQLGLLLGLAMCLRWQNAVLLVLPGLDLLAAFRGGPGGPRSESRRRPLLPPALACAAALVLGAFPQMAAWKVIYGEWLLRYPPHGADFLRLSHPFVLETLFSSRHGLLSWTPILWLGYLGFVPLWRRRPQLAGPLLLPLLLMTYVNMCSGDWWAGGSFSNRRFDSLLPVLACGLAAALDALARLVSHRPQLAVAALVLPLVTWNGLVLADLRGGLVARHDTVSFPHLVGGAAARVADNLGSPRTWPASWVFAWREGRSPAQYDRLVGRYLFYRQNNLGGRIDLGRAGDEVMLGEGWGPREEEGDVDARRFQGAARVFAPLDVPEALAVAVRGAAVGAPAEIGVFVNGRAAGRLRFDTGWSAPALLVPQEFWRRELNDVVLVSSGGPVRVDALELTRHGAGDDAKGFRAR